MELYAVKIDKELDQDKFEEYLAVIPPERKKKIKAFLRREDSIRSLIPEILLRSIIIKQFEIPNDMILFNRNYYGKPFLEGAPGFHFNISHSGCWVILGVDSKELGVDVEKVKAIDLDIAGRFFSESEYKDLISKPASLHYDYFFTLWALKESYIKAVGMGLSLPLNSFSMVVGDDEIQIIKETGCGYYFKMYSIDSDYKTAVCALAPDFPVTPRILSIDDLYSYFLEVKNSTPGSLIR